MTALEDILSQEIVQRLGWMLLHFIWQATAIAVLLAILLAALRKAPANLRYTVSCLALGLIVLLPTVTMWLVDGAAAQPPVVPESAQAPVVLRTEQVEEIPMAEMQVVEVPAKPEEPRKGPAIPWRQRAAERFEPALPHIVTGWLLGVFALSLWHLGGWTQLQRLRRKMVEPVDVSLRAKLDELAETLGVKRAVQLTESALVQIPTVVGWLRPVILLPASALTGLAAEQLEAILAHELAHIRRHDYLVNMLQTVVETLGFYHPAVWWVSHRIRAEREDCCDDLAVGVCGDRIGYARALASMEEIRAGRNELAVAASGGNLLRRICRLLGKESSDCGRTSWIPSAIAMLLLATIAIPTTLALTTRDTSDIGSPEATQIGGKSTENVQAPRALGVTPTPAAEHKAHVRVDCLVVEIYPSMTIDRETLIAAENLVGQSVATPADGGKAVPRRRWPSGKDVSRSWKPTVEQFIREVVGAITKVPFEELSSVANNAQTTQKLIDLLASRGYMRILMAPTLEVVEGQTARIASEQSRLSDLQVRPRIVDGGIVRLQAEGTIIREFPQQDKEQLPSVESVSFSTEVGLLPGWSLIVGGASKSGQASEDRADADVAGGQMNELLIVISPTILDSATGSESPVGTPVESGDRREDESVSQSTRAKVSRGPAPSDGLARPVMISCLVLEVYPHTPLDRESIIAAENLLGEKAGSSTSGKSVPTVEELIGKVTATTMSIGEHSIKTTGGQMMQKMIDLLASRGAVRILMNPTIEVVDGGKGRVESKRKVPMGKATPPSTRSGLYVDVIDYLETTAHILDDGRIRLLTEGTINRELPRQDKDQPPAITSSSFSTQAVIETGQSLTVGATKDRQAGAKDLEEPQTEFLFILTPTIVETTKPQDETGVVSTATPKALPQKMITRVYDVTDLIGEPADHGGMSRLMHAHILVQFIQERVEPESWHDLSDTGEGTITPYPMQEPRKLAIYNAARSHRAIQRLIEKVRSGAESVPAMLLPDDHKESTYPPQINELLEFDRRVKKSAEMLMYFGRAMLVYANDHDGRYPNLPDQLREYLHTEQFTWARQNIEYFGGGRTVSDDPDVVLAYRKLIPGAKGTNVLFNDGHVEFISGARMSDLNISITTILVETRILTVDDNFLKAIELDANSVGTSELLSAASGAEPNSWPYLIVLDDLEVSHLLRAVGAHDGSKILAAPQVCALDGREATIKVVSEEYHLLGPVNPNDPPGKAKAKPEAIEVGTSIRLTPHVTPDKKNVVLDFEWLLRQIRGLERRAGPDKKKHKFPLVTVNEIETIATIPEGKTLLVGRKITKQMEVGSKTPVLGDLPLVGGLFRNYSKITDQKMLLILIKPTVDPQIPPPTPPALDPDDPLATKPREKSEGH